MSTVINLVPKDRDEFHACVNCRHLIDGHIWYNQYCRASPLPKVRDPYDGKIKAYGTNDLGDPYSSNVPYKHARYVNLDGKCDKYERKA